MNDLQRALDLAQNSDHKYLIGELAAALIVAKEALEEAARPRLPLLSYGSAKAARKALVTLEAMSGPDGRLGSTRLKNLEAEFNCLRDAPRT